MKANVQKGLPDLVGLIAVFSSETGMPLGLVDGSSVTGMRTGAAGAIGAKYLARKNSQNALIVGTGNQAPFQIAALLKVFPTLETIRIANPHNAGHAAAFASKIRAMLQTDFAIEAASATFEGVSDLQEAVSDSDIIITITPSRTPLIQNPAHIFPALVLIWRAKKKLIPKFLRMPLFLWTTLNTAGTPEKLRFP